MPAWKQHFTISRDLERLRCWTIPSDSALLLWSAVTLPRAVPAGPCGFFGHQPHGPAGTALGRVTADHSNNALSLGIVQQRSRSRSRLIVKCCLDRKSVV